jgi:nucleoside-diphosphate-sugar epimerase
MNGSFRTLAITGVPGWFTQALLDDLRIAPLENYRVRALVHPSLEVSAILARNPELAGVEPYDLLAGNGSALKAVDVLVHAAAVIHVRRTSEWYRLNTEGTKILAQKAREAGVRRFVFLSSNAAGGRCESPTQVLTEAVPSQPLSHYGRSKLLAEEALMRLHEPGRFEVTILRPSMFYGPPVPDRHVDVYRRILHGRMPMVGNGNYRRSITYIDNLVQAARLAVTHPAASGETFYVVDEPIYTTGSITEAMAAALGARLRFLRLPEWTGPVAYRVDRALASAGIYWQNLHLVGEAHWHVAISCRKLQQRLGYSPAITLKEGMRRSVEWCRREGKI